MTVPFHPVRPDEGLLFATRLPGQPSDFPKDCGSTLWPWNALCPDSARPLWVHLDRTKAEAANWLREASGLEPQAAEILLAETTRPGCWADDRGLAVILRGVNLNEGADPDELIAIRVWIDPGQLITLRAHRFQTVADLRTRASAGKAPATPGAVLATIALGLTERLGPVVENQLGLLDEVEDQLLDEQHDLAQHAASMRQRLTLVRRQSIMLRRYLAPQRDALAALAGESHEALSPKDRATLRRAADQTARCVEDLDELRDRAAVANDELRARREDRIGRTTYLLTLVATIALPLGLITGLLGINVGGVPGVDSPIAFWVVTAGMTALAIGGIVLFKFIRWL